MDAMRARVRSVSLPARAPQPDWEGLRLRPHELRRILVKPIHKTSCGAPVSAVGGAELLGLSTQFFVSENHLTGGRVFDLYLCVRVIPQSPTRKVLCLAKACGTIG